MNMVVDEGEVVVTMEDVERKNVSVGIVEETITFYNAQDCLEGTREE
jgi:hypothetical protein